jgi:hypothetical protein
MNDLLIQSVLDNASKIGETAAKCDHEKSRNNPSHAAIILELSRAFDVVEQAYWVTADGLKGTE